MKKIKVTLKIEVDVEVDIDETVIDKGALDAIAEHFDDEIYEEPTSCDDELTPYEIGLFNYAKSAALVASGIGEVEYINLSDNHTKAKETDRWVDAEFGKILTIPNAAE